MQIQQINPKILTITQMRRDIDQLKSILLKEQEALVMKNQRVMFVVITPERYQLLQSTRKERTVKALTEIKNIQNRYKFKKQPISDFIIHDRDRRAKE